MLDVLARAAGSFFSRLVRANTPHTVLLADGGRTIFALPRAAQAGGGATAGLLVVALAEAVGLGVVYRQDDYDSYDDARFVAALEDVCLPPAQLDALQTTAVECALEAAEAARVVPPAARSVNAHTARTVVPCARNNATVESAPFAVLNII